MRNRTTYNKDTLQEAIVSPGMDLVRAVGEGEWKHVRAEQHCCPRQGTTAHCGPLSLGVLDNSRRKDKGATEEELICALPSSVT